MINPCSRCQKLTEAISRNLGKFLGDSKDGVLHIFTQQSSQHMRYCKGEGYCDQPQTWHQSPPKDKEINQFRICACRPLDRIYVHISPQTSKQCFMFSSCIYIIHFSNWPLKMLCALYFVKYVIDQQRTWRLNECDTYMKMVKHWWSVQGAGR